MRPRHILSASLITFAIAGCIPSDNGEETPETDAGGQEGDASTEPDVGTTPPLTMFLSSGTYETSLGLASLDAACGQEAKATAGTSYKVLVASPARLPANPTCETPQEASDWVLAPNTTYQREDGEVLFTTGASSIFTDWPMENLFSNSGANFATGMDRDWCLIPDQHCSGWTSSEGRAAVGWTASGDGGFLEGGDLGCGGRVFVCVEQP